MAVLRAVQDANDWVFIHGMTGPDSVDPLGPAATSARLSVSHGCHYVGAYAPSPSRAILRAYFDELEPSQNELGYIVTVQSLCLNRPIDFDLLPTFRHLARYAVEPSDGSTFLDFMGLGDAQMRFANAGLGERPVDAPLYPFTAFLRLSSNDFSNIFWHPMPNGSLRHGAGIPPAGNTRPPWVSSEVPAQAASLHLLIRPFMMVEGDIEQSCRPETTTFERSLPLESVQELSLFELIRRAYFDEYNESLPVIIDASAAGPYLILIAEDNSAIIARHGPVNADPSVLSVWQMDHDSFERIEQNVAGRMLAVLQDRLISRYHISGVSVTRPSGRGTRPLQAPPPLGFANELPTFSLDYSMTLVERRRFTRTSAQSPVVPRSTVSTRFDWVYDLENRCFNLKVNPPRVRPSIPEIGAFCQAYRDKVFGGVHDPDPHDLSPFTLAGAPWLDGAPAAPLLPTRPLF